MKATGMFAHPPPICPFATLAFTPLVKTFCDFQMYVTMVTAMKLSNRPPRIFTDMHAPGKKEKKKLYNAIKQFTTRLDVARLRK